MILTSVDIFEQSASHYGLTLQTRHASKLNLIELEMCKTCAGDSRSHTFKRNINDLSIQTNRLEQLRSAVAVHS